MLPMTDADTARAGWRLEQMVSRLKARGHRMTPQRLAVFKAILAEAGHPSAEQVFRAVAGEYPSMSLATVYKTLTLLKQEGEVLELGFAGQESRYDGLIPKPHPHLVCRRCGEIVDPPFLDLEPLTRDMADRTGYRIDFHRLDFYGLCPRCQGEAAKEEASGEAAGKEKEEAPRPSR